MRSVCPHGNVVHLLPISKLNGPKGVRPKLQSLNHFNVIKFIANFTVDIYPEITQRFYSTQFWRRNISPYDVYRHLSEMHSIWKYKINSQYKMYWKFNVRN